VFAAKAKDNCVIKALFIVSTDTQYYKIVEILKQLTL
jgi:hypothetical protein